ncbi:hypothetical protein BS50DRAFT_659656 [Corynespora cassiicola Philippines]|uniref:Uncharacterized protein n=1 Tax=Corynespora cassiicola Philippines TaxID=1448308 RepID=A0A2T2NZQ8_CORCC|nr:hypothetical protein BS50DRAFT_659656 [Corynespora cassiicola Philippines]
MATQGREFAYKAAEEMAIMVCIDETECADTCNLDAHPSLFRSKNDVLLPYMRLNITQKVIYKTTIAMRPRDIAMEITTFYRRGGLPGVYSTPYRVHSGSQVAAIVFPEVLLFITLFKNEFLLRGKTRNHNLKRPAFVSPVAFEKAFQDLGIPEQEGSRAVGQWASWVHLAFAIIVALFCRITYPDSESYNIWKSNKRERPRQRMPRWLCGIEEAWYLLVVLQEDWADLVAKWKKTRAILGENHDNSMPLHNFTPLDDNIPLDEESGEFLVWEQIRNPGRSPEIAFLSP